MNIKIGILNVPKHDNKYDLNHLVTNAQADLILRWAYSHFVGFAMRRLSC